MRFVLTRFRNKHPGEKLLHLREVLLDLEEILVTEMVAETPEDGTEAVRVAVDRRVAAGIATKAKTVAMPPGFRKVVLRNRELKFTLDLAKNLNFNWCVFPLKSKRLTFGLVLDRRN